MACYQAPFTHADKRPQVIGMDDDPVEIVVPEIYAIYRKFLSLLESESDSEADTNGT
jgi:hypothetical protein